MSVLICLASAMRLGEPMTFPWRSFVAGKGKGNGHGRHQSPHGIGKVFPFEGKGFKKKRFSQFRTPPEK